MALRDMRPISPLKDTIYDLCLSVIGLSTCDRKDGGGIGESEEDEVERAKTTQIQKTGEGGVGRKSVLQAVRNKSPGIHTRGHTDRRKMG